MQDHQHQFNLTVSGWNGNHWLNIVVVNDSIEMSTSDDDPFDMPYVESATQWKDALNFRIGQLIAQFLYETKTKTKNR